MSECKYEKAWTRPCGLPSDGDWCEKHAPVMCECGAKATGECDFDMAFVCGAPTCHGFLCHLHQKHRA